MKSRLDKKAKANFIFFAAPRLKKKQNLPYHFSDSSSCHEIANIIFLSEDVSNLCSIVYSILLFKLSKSRLRYLQFSRHFNVSYDFTSGVLCYLLCIYVPILHKL